MATSSVSVPVQSAASQRQHLKLSKLPLAGLLTIGLATILNVVLFFVFSALGTLTPSVQIQTFAGAQPLDAVMVATNTILQMLVGLVVLTGIIRFRGSDAERVWQMVAGVVLVLTLVLPFTGIPEAPLAYSLSLIAMHIVAGALAIWMLPALARES